MRSTTSDVRRPASRVRPLRPGLAAVRWVVLAAALTGCGSAGEVGTAQELAATLAAQAPAPPGGHPVTGLPGAVFAHPGEQPACDPLVLRTSFWTTPASVDATSAALQRPDAQRFTVTGSGSGSGGGEDFRMIVLAPRGAAVTAFQPPSVVYVVAAVEGATGVRSDVEVVPDGAGCVRS